MANKCEKCGLYGLNKGFDIPSIIFNYLEGQPAICEICIYETFVGKRPEWASGWAKFITKP